MTMQHLIKERRREVVVNVGGEYSRALVFAVPVVLLDPQGFGLCGDDLDSDGLCDLLKLRSGLNVQGQGVHVLPRLFSPQLLANLISRDTEREFAARMVEDCVREQLKGDSLMARRLAASVDGSAEMPLRFVIGCVFQDVWTMPSKWPLRSAGAPRGSGQKPRRASGLSDAKEELAPLSFRRCRCKTAWTRG